MITEERKSEYLKRIQACNSHDPEIAHLLADELLCEIIEKELGDDYKEILDAYNRLEKWCA